ncbi:hypothetical protein HanXRQr2_Chr08g0335471 [Helianthus annuus]|uniref:Uncharacterized protein n=1 Tax=Helianthus annuus TaxID=4232 RepID=A0A9K3IDY4_HELAN|nr:hypothetical protein HanXRQr2_Chr08g0335471 [Helianthus annuus]
MALAGDKHVESSSGELILGKSISVDIVHVNHVHNVHNFDHVSDCKPIIVRSKTVEIMNTVIVFLIVILNLNHYFDFVREILTAS